MKKSKPKKLWMVYINLVGLWDRVILVKWDDALDEYFDKDGNISYSPSSPPLLGVSQITFKNKRDAICALMGAKMVRDHLKDVL